jgi:pimeloyl-ACP methyl ester carboxylesterase
VSFCFISTTTRHWQLTLGLIAGVLSCLPATAQRASEEEQTQAALAGIYIAPSKTDPEIKTFDFSHRLHVDRDIVVREMTGKPAARHELLVFLPGTGGRAKGTEAFCQLAASQGYHVIRLLYPDDVSASVSRRDKDPKAFEEFRLCLIQGGTSPHITVSRADSIENRLIKLLVHLKKVRGREGWGEYLDEAGGLNWEKLVLSGQSQGGGHAVLMAMKHKVARVIATGAPKDWSLVTNAPAAWLTNESATPRSRIFAFNHEQDFQACTPEQQWQILKTLGLDQFGPVTSVDAQKPPYNHSRSLSTNYPGGTLESKPAHGSVIANQYEEIFRPVWLYMLTEPTTITP